MKSMTYKILTVLFFALSTFAHADWSIPDPVTYEWTVEHSQRVIPKVDSEDTTIDQVITYLSDSMSFPIRLKHDLPADILNKKINWHFDNITWLALVAKIADIADADIVIEKRIVTLRSKRPAN